MATTLPESRERAEAMADLYSIIVTLEHVETSFVRDALTSSEYTPLCSRLIAQYKTLLDARSRDLPEMEAFCKTYGLNCNAAVQRLRTGVPATVIYGGGTLKRDDGNELVVFHAVQHYITAMDSLKLGSRAADELTPLLTDLMESLNKVQGLSPEHEALLKVREWLLTVSGMRAHEELNDVQCRQMSFDLDGAYNAFHRFIEGRKGK